MTAMYTPLAEITLSSPVLSVTFGSIPNTFRDLMIIGDGGLSGLNDFLIRVNGDSAANYTNVIMSGNGSSAVSGALDTNNYRTNFYGRWSANNGINNIVIHLMDYATDKHKSILTRTNAESDGVAASAGRWASSSAINTVTLLSNGVNFVSGSTFLLFGVK